MTVSSAELGNAILRKAHSFAGIHETAANRKWSNAEKSGHLVEWMKRVGWQPGWPYCAAACEAVWRWTYGQYGLEAFFLKSVAPVLGPHCMTMFRVADARGLIVRRPEQAQAGAIIIWRHGSSDRGHAGIFGGWIPGAPKPLLTVEANTGSGNEREGDGIYAKARPFPTMGSLRCQGFINPILPSP